MARIKVFDKSTQSWVYADKSFDKTSKPVKGVDYWTEADQESIVQQVITAMGTPVFGRVDEANNIVLTGELAAGTYMLKYEDAEGNQAEIGTVKIDGAMVNQLPISTDATGAIYNSTSTRGYKKGYRLSTEDGLTEKTNSATSLTGYIPVANGDIIRLANMSFIKDSADAYKGMVYAYSALGVYISHVDTTNVIGSWNGVTDSNGNVTQFTVTQEGVAFIRIAAAEITDSSIITVNQEIQEEESAYTNLFDPAMATINTRMSGTSSTPKTDNGYVMTALIPIPKTAVGGGATTSEHFVVVPATMWTGSANMFLAYNDSSPASGYMDANTTKGTVVGNWVKIPLINQYSNSFTCRGITVSLKVSSSAITASDIQNIEIYFDEIPE